MSRILWIAPKWPLPPHDGARLVTANLLKAMSQAGHAIDLLAITEAGAAVDEAEACRNLGLRSATAIRRHDHPAAGWRRALSLAARTLIAPCIPVTLQPYAAPHIKASIERALRGAECAASPTHAPDPTPHEPPWDAVVYDGLHPAIHSSLIGEFFRPQTRAKIIYRAHNVESIIWERKTEMVEGLSLIHI